MGLCMLHDALLQLSKSKPCPDFGWSTNVPQHHLGLHIKHRFSLVLRSPFCVFLWKHTLKALKVYGHIMDTFVHDPIDLSQPAIRLARLFRGWYTNPIRCEIFEAFLDLSEIVPYKALSYVWGDESEKNEICINEKRAFVASNLFNALKSLRQIDEDSILWVDAMCIDQSNNREKGHQVSQMRLVYERAEEVIIWLGESDADIDILFDGAWKLDKAVGKLRTHNTTYDVWQTLWEEKEKDWPHFDASSGIRYKDRRRSALKGLLERPWFKRVWVIQVIVLSLLPWVID